MSSPTETRLADLGLSLPPVPPPAGNYVPTMEVSGLLYVSGQLPKDAEGRLLSGRVGADLTVEDGKKAAQACALNIITQAKAALGDLSRIEAVVRLNGFVNATADFTDHPLVINGASDLFCQVFEDVGRHTRIAVGVASLPAGAAVEIDAIFKVKDA